MRRLEFIYLIGRRSNGRLSGAVSEVSRIARLFILVFTLLLAISATTSAQTTPDRENGRLVLIL